jgi:DNA segregation ATPase FtsK/SpoIIIE-like protein
MNKEDRSKLIERLADSIEQTYASFGLRLIVIGILKQKGVTIFIMDLAIGLSVKQIPKYKDTIALLLGVKADNINYHIPYKTTPYVGLEVKKDLEFFNNKSETEIFEDPNFIKIDRPSK